MVISYSFLGSFTIRAAVFMEFQDNYFRWQQRHRNTVHHPQASACWDSMRCKSFPKFSTCAKHDSVSILKKSGRLIVAWHHPSPLKTTNSLKLTPSGNLWKLVPKLPQLRKWIITNHGIFQKGGLAAMVFWRFCPRKPEVIKPHKNSRPLPNSKPTNLFKAS